MVQIRGTLYKLLQCDVLSQVHCIVALLRLHRKHILRLRAPEDFVQVSVQMFIC